MKKSVVVLIVTVAILVSACNVSNNPPQYNEILSSTVQINMWILNDGNGSVKNNLTVEQAQALLETSHSVMLIQGLGTVVQVEGENTIITHNHWGQLTDVGLIQFSDASGVVLLSMTRFEFKKLILFQDGGTMILRAPENLGIAPAAMGSFDQVATNHTIYIARRQPGNMNNVEVVEARLELAIDYKNQEAWELQALNGDVISPGDSGGGIWLNGQWIGNTWAIRAIEFANGDWEAEGTIYAAQCPPQVFTIVADNKLDDDAGKMEVALHGEKHSENE